MSFIRQSCLEDSRVTAATHGYRHSHSRLLTLPLRSLWSHAGSRLTFCHVPTTALAWKLLTIYSSAHEAPRVALHNPPTWALDASFCRVEPFVNTPSRSSFQACSQSGFRLCGSSKIDPETHCVVHTYPRRWSTSLPRWDDGTCGHAGCFA